MGARGRKPATEVATIPNIGVEDRPQPPLNLNDEQQGEWIQVVNRLPADWFPSETHSMLAQYCRHASTANKVAFLIAEMESRPVSQDAVEEGEVVDAYFDLDDYNKLLNMQERESRAMTALARSLRFTLQATYDKEKKKPPVGDTPWDTEDSHKEH